jgi:hypothetical protein
MNLRGARSSATCNRYFDGINIAIEFDENTDENINVYFQFADGPQLPVDAAGSPKQTS